MASKALIPYLRNMVMTAVIGGGLGYALPLSAAPQPNPVRNMKALSALEKGMWEVREKGSKHAPRKLCVQDMVRLMQIDHDKMACKQYIVADVDDKASITYECAGRGGGRTDLRVETSKLAQIDTQGILNGMPFSESLEARHIGSCR